MRGILMLVFVSGCLCGAPIPISGGFGYGTNANFIDIFGPEFGWQFHQGDGLTTYQFCTDAANCDASLSNSVFQGPFLPGDGFAFAENGPDQARIGTLPNVGAIFGGLTFRVSRTDWSDLPDGFHGGDLAVSVRGHIGARTDAGVMFIDHLVKAEGTFGVEINKGPGFIAFSGGFGQFQGVAVPASELPEPIPEPATSLLVLTALAAGVVRRRICSGSAVAQSPSGKSRASRERHNGATAGDGFSSC